MWPKSGRKVCAFSGNILTALAQNKNLRYHASLGAIFSKEKPVDTQVKGKAVGTAKAKREKFVQLAQSRTINAIRAIRVIGKLGNKSHYQYDESDVKKIVAALSKEVDALKARMTEQGSRVAIEFKL